MNYDITELFGNLPATAGSFNETVELRDHMVILELNLTSGKPKKEKLKLLALIVDALNKDTSTHPLILKCDNNSFPDKDVIHRTLQDGYIYSSYFTQIPSNIQLESFVVKNRKKLWKKGSILCFPDALLGFSYDYLFVVVFNKNLLEKVKKIVTECHYVNSGRNYFGMPTLGLNKFDSPYLDFSTPISDNKFSYVKYLDKTTRKILKAFSPVHYVLRSCNNRLLDEGHFIRIDLDDSEKNSNINAAERSLLQILQLLEPTHQKMRLIYHGVIADSTKGNKLLLSGKLHQDEDSNFQLQSFLSPAEIDVRDFLRGKFDRVLLDETIFFNKDMIFTFYDSGADFRFFNKRDYGRFFELCNTNHTIQMASYIPGREDEYIYPYRP